MGILDWNIFTYLMRVEIALAAHNCQRQPTLAYHFRKARILSKQIVLCSIHT